MTYLYWLNCTVKYKIAIVADYRGIPLYHICIDTHLEQDGFMTPHFYSMNVPYCYNKCCKEDLSGRKALWTCDSLFQKSKRISRALDNISHIVLLLSRICDRNRY